MTLDQSTDNHTVCYLTQQTWVHIAYQLFAFAYNVQTCSAYFVSADGFFPHLAQAKHLPSWIHQHSTWMTTHLHDLETPATTSLFILTTLVIACLAIANQLKMPERNDQLFKWLRHSPTSSGTKLGIHSEVDGSYQQSPAPPQRRSPRSFNHNCSLLKTGCDWTAIIGKTIIQTSSLCSFLATFNFTLAMTLSSIVFVGNFMSQVVNFKEHDNKLNPEQSSWIISKLSHEDPQWCSRFFAICYALGNMGLYFNTVDQGPQRLGWTTNKIMDLEHQNVRITLISLHVIFSLIFTALTYINYRRKIYKTLQAKTQPLLDNPTSDNTQHPIITKLSILGCVAVFYKAFATFFSMLKIIDLLQPLQAQNNSALAGSYICVIALTLFSIPTQATFYSKTDAVLSRESTLTQTPPDCNLLGMSCV